MSGCQCQYLHDVFTGLYNTQYGNSLHTYHKIATYLWLKKSVTDRTETNQIISIFHLNMLNGLMNQKNMHMKSILIVVSEMYHYSVNIMLCKRYSYESCVQLSWWKDRNLDKGIMVLSSGGLRMSEGQGQKNIGRAPQVWGGGVVAMFLRRRRRRRRPTSSRNKGEHLINSLEGTTNNYKK